MKNRVMDQGRVIAERDPDSTGWFVMFPDGSIRWFADRTAVITAVKATQKPGPEDIIFTRIEWRH